MRLLLVMLLSLVLLPDVSVSVAATVQEADAKLLAAYRAKHAAATRIQQMYLQPVDESREAAEEAISNFEGPPDLEISAHFSFAMAEDHHDAASEVKGEVTAEWNNIVEDQLQSAVDNYNIGQYGQCVIDAGFARIMFDLLEEPYTFDVDVLNAIFYYENVVELLE